MLKHDRRRNTPTLPVVHALLKPGSALEPENSGERGVASCGGNELFGLGCSHAEDYKHSVYTMSNVLCTTPLHDLFSIRAVDMSGANRPIDNLLKRAKARGLSQAKLARAMNVPNQHVTNWKRRGLPAAQYAAAAQAVECSIDQLLYRQPPTSAPTPVLPHRSVEAARFAAEWDKLHEPARTQIQVMVEALVAAQIVEQSGTKKRKGQPEGDRPQSR